ncbi:aminodeoxychorismate/anthranilate synthase component II [Candidatus Parvarchaeota archaeon]|nr:aminodeoxychorismate/anthranilate synthase component II [Candidatus Parvarchaeota archaeon]
MKILLIDNFDSFVYNIYQYLSSLGCTVEVFRNDKITLEQIGRQGYDGIVISPGPGDPSNKRDFGVCMQAIQCFGKSTPILGVCLGHQGIICAFGGTVIRAKKPMHGKPSMIKHDGSGIFSGVSNPLKVMRYHSLVGDEKTFPACLEVTARSLDDNAIMAVVHKSLKIYGVQFHPEAILSQGGLKIFSNFLNIARGNGESQ